MIIKESFGIGYLTTHGNEIVVHGQGKKPRKIA